MNARWVIVGLGNPGQRYALTRHNFGRLVLEEFARAEGWSWKENKLFNARVIKEHLGDKEVHLLIPLFYMNESGHTVRSYLDYYKIEPKELLIICDDVALEFGQMRLRPQGTSGGHNGLKNIALHLGTENFARLRMGISRRLAETQTLADYVLSHFDGEEMNALEAIAKQGAAAVKLIVTEAFDKVMSQVNRGEK